jgi:hypothetical protein
MKVKKISSLILKFPKKTFIRKKPSIRVKKTKFGLEIIKTIYDDYGKVLKKQIESVGK